MPNNNCDDIHVITSIHHLSKTRLVEPLKTMARLKKPKTHSTTLFHFAFINHTTVRRCTISHAAAKISCICQISKILFVQPNSQPFLCFYPFSKKTHGYLCCGDPILTWAVFRLACGLQFSTRPFCWWSSWSITGTIILLVLVNLFSTPQTPQVHC